VTPAARRATDLLERVIGSLQSAEQRDGQFDMVRHVADAIETRRPLVIQAGTGTGKTLGYLVPVLAAGQTAVVATYTKALQDQLASADLPLLEAATRDDPDIEFTWAVLKGRNNYLCRQRLNEIETAHDSLEFDAESATTRRETLRLIEWSSETESGDHSDVPFPVSDSAWRKVSIGSDECPGAARCAFGESCYSERARERASAANVVVVNFSLYGLDLQHDREFLPHHDVVVFDEVHELEDVVSDTASIVLTPRAIAQAAETARKALRSQKVPNALATSAGHLDEILQPYVGERFKDGLPADLADIIRGMLAQVDLILEGVRAASDESPEVLRAKRGTERLREDLTAVLASNSEMVYFVSESRNAPRLTAAPLRVDGVLRPVWSDTVAILTSATIPAGLPRRLGLDIDDDDLVRVASPFDYRRNSLLYLPADLPEPNHPTRAQRVHERITELVTLSGGSALVLFTSRSAMALAVESLRGSLGAGIVLHAQDDMPKKALLEAFRTDERSCLFATRGYFQGVDVPGDALRLVIIDKVPFPALRDPLLDARREHAGPGAFMSVDVPMAAATLAQAAGRLIRSARDHGVVAILDSRLATKRYKTKVLAGVSHIPETASLEDVERFYLRRRNVTVRQPSA
jgi:ATP-dependent DNA helicase DinG